jgi:polyhydroxyalkanoate synthesis regulator phasin
MFRTTIIAALLLPGSALAQSKPVDDLRKHVEALEQRVDDGG